MTGRAHDARILAAIEAEFRERDPRLLALFDRFGPGAAAAPAPLRRRVPWRRALAAVLLIALPVAVALTSGGWLAALSARAYSTAAGLASRANTDVQSWTTDIQAQVCRSVPAHRASCG